MGPRQGAAALPGRPDGVALRHRARRALSDRRAGPPAVLRPGARPFADVERHTPERGCRAVGLARRPLGRGAAPDARRNRPAPPDSRESRPEAPDAVLVPRAVFRHRPRLGPLALDRPPGRIRHQPHRHAPPALPRRDLPAPVGLYGPGGGAAPHAGERRGPLRDQRRCRLLAAGDGAAFDAPRLGRLLLPTSTLLLRYGDRPFAQPRARPHGRIRVGLLDEGVHRVQLADLDAQLHDAAHHAARAARGGQRPSRPAPGQVLRERRGLLRVLLQQHRKGPHAAQHS